jgi:hypothetical protein
MTTQAAATFKNTHLIAARSAKNDEFYTQWADIEREMNAYLEYDADVFRDKVILLPCDDPEWSNFTKFFALHFMDFGIKKLISTSYAPDSNPAGEFYQPTLLETDDPKFDETRTHANGKVRGFQLATMTLTERDRATRTVPSPITTSPATRTAPSSSAARQLSVKMSGSRATGKNV